MSKPLYIIMACLMLVTLIGCNTAKGTTGVWRTSAPSMQLSPSKQPAIETISVPTQIKSPIIATKTATKRVLSPTPTSSPTPTLTPSPSFPPIVKRCLELAPAGEGNFLDTGSLVVRRGVYEYGILSLPSMQTKVILKNVDYFLGASPYTGSLAWVGVDKALHVRIANGVVYKINIDDKVISFHWLADDRMIMRFYFEKEEYPVPAVDTFDIITPETGNIEHYQLELPGYYALSVDKWSFPYLPEYDPAFTRALYGWQDPNSTEQGMRLWDIQEQKEIWTKGGWHGFIEHSRPDWFVDGSKFALPARVPEENSRLEVFSVTADGKEERLTHFGDEIKDIYDIRGNSWSPDGRYIAIQLNILNSENSDPFYFNLYILDTITGIVTDYCAAPVHIVSWSPKSDKLILYLGDKEITLDIETGRAQEVPVNVSGDGWVNWTVP